MSIDHDTLQKILWMELLRIVSLKGYDQGTRNLHAAFTEMRTYGTNIARLDSGKFALRPVFNSNDAKGTGWKSQEDYEAWKLHNLKPYHEKLIECLTSLYCGALADAEQVERIRDALFSDDSKGFVRLKSAALDGEVVVIARDYQAGQKAPKGAVVYTLTELGNLRDCPPTVKDLRAIHEAKKLFKGTVMEG